MEHHPLTPLVGSDGVGVRMRYRPLKCLHAGNNEEDNNTKNITRPLFLCFLGFFFFFFGKQNKQNKKATDKLTIETELFSLNFQNLGKYPVIL